MPALSHFPRAAYGRFKVRFKPGYGILAFHDSEGIDIVDISDVGFKLKNDGRFEEGKAFFSNSHFKTVAMFQVGTCIRNAVGFQQMRRASSFCLMAWDNPLARSSRASI